DFMPVGPGSGRPQALVRRVVVVRGTMAFRVEVAPRFDYGRSAHEVERHEHGVVFRSARLSLALGTDLPFELRDGDAHSSFVLGEDDGFGLELVCWEGRTAQTVRYST